MKLRGRKTKKCPRCGNKCLISQAKCDECGLLFARLDDATNKAGKIRLARKQKEYVIYVSKCPKDIKKWKLILIVTFLGLFGGHYFYIGRWKWGLAMLCYFFAVLFIGVIFNAFFIEWLNGNIFSLFGPLTGIYTFIWLNDIRRVVFNTFKIPVSILSDQENEEYLRDKEQGKQIKKEIKGLVKEHKKEKQDSEEGNFTEQGKNDKTVDLNKDRTSETETEAEENNKSDIQLREDNTCKNSENLVGETLKPEESVEELKGIEGKEAIDSEQNQEVKDENSSGN